GRPGFATRSEVEPTRETASHAGRRSITARERWAAREPTRETASHAGPLDRPPGRSRWSRGRTLRGRLRLRRATRGQRHVHRSGARTLGRAPGLRQGRIKKFASAPAPTGPSSGPHLPPRHKHDRGPTMRQHPRLHGVDVRSWIQGLFGATSWRTLGFDEPVDDLLTCAELLDAAIEDLY